MTGSRIFRPDSANDGINDGPAQRMGVTRQLPWRETGGGVELAVRLTPRAGASRIDGIEMHGDLPVLRMRVAAPPVEGAANAALAAFVARSLALPRSSVTVVAGARSRLKRLAIADPRAAERLAALLGE